MFDLAIRPNDRIPVADGVEKGYLFVEFVW